MSFGRVVVFVMWVSLALEVFAAEVEVESLFDEMDSTTEQNVNKSTNSSLPVPLVKGPSAQRRQPRRNRWRQVGTSVSKSVSSNQGLRDQGGLVPGSQVSTRQLSGPTGPPLDLALNATVQAILQSHRQLPPSPLRPPGIVAPPSSGLIDIWNENQQHRPAVFPPAAPPGPIILPPAPPIPRPPSPPPSPPPPPTGAFTVGPIKPPMSTFPGRPQPTHVAPAGEPDISEIRCVVGRSIASLQALISLPNERLDTVPVLHERPNIDLVTDPACRVFSSTPGKYRLLINDLQRCAVHECEEDGQKLLCLTLRFPTVSGLQLPEDELAEIRCKPQDPTAEDTHAVKVTTSEHVSLDREASLFEGGGQNFQCEIALFRKDPSSSDFTDRVLKDTELELGEEVQLWSIVKAGDGWLFSRMVEVTVHRSGVDPQFSTPRDRAELVFSDGCLNPIYRAISQHAPTPNIQHRLLNKFTFRVFLFQDMQPGESIVLTAKVIGCVEEIDCQMARDCSLHSGQRKKRELGEMTFSTTLIPSTTQYPVPPPPRQQYIPFEPEEILKSDTTERKHTKPILTPPPGILPHSSLFNGTTDWTRSIALNIRKPQDYDVVRKHALSPPQCQMYLFLTVGVAIAFFLATVVFVISILAYRRHQLKNNRLSQHSKSTSSSSLGTNSALSKVSTTTSSSKSEKTDTASDTEGEFSWLPQIVVPATVKQRKRQLNTELLDTFQKGTLPLPSCPALVNYYGYMVVPRKAPSSVGRTKDKQPERRRRRSKSCSSSKSVNGTLDHRLDLELLRQLQDTEIETSSLSDDISLQPVMQSHKEKYKRKQRQAEKYRSSLDQLSNHKWTKQNNDKHQVTISVNSPPVPPPNKTKVPYSRTMANTRRDNTEHFYEEPVTSRPVMV